MQILGTTKVCCLIGDPVAHSLSPPMHNIAFKLLRLDYVYVAFRVSKNKLEDAVAGLKGLGIVGANVTIPHKVSIIKYLDKIDEMAENIGAVNTIVNVDDQLVGYNTDGLAAVKVLKENNVKIKNGKFLILGAGGVARAILFYLAKEDAELTILNRTLYKAEQLAQDISRKIGCKIKVLQLNQKNIRKEIEDTEVLINCTSVGMHPNVNETLVPHEFLKRNLVVFDTVYNPYKTRLLREAEIKGAKIISGVKMLVYQGAEAFKLWTGLTPPVNAMESVVLEYLKIK